MGKEALPQDRRKRCDVLVLVDDGKKWEWVEKELRSGIDKK